MISRHFRSQSAFILPSGVTNLFQTENISLSNAEIFIILQMNDKYQKLSFDRFWIRSLNLYSESIKQLEASLVLTNSDHQRITEKRIIFERNFMLNDHPLSEFEQNEYDFYVMREYELKLHNDSVSLELQTEKMRMAAILYNPLIDCIKSLIKFHEGQNCNGICRWRVSGFYDISKIMLSIFHYSHIKLSKFDNFETWKKGNIFLHPLIALSEERIEKSLSVFSTTPVSMTVDNTLNRLGHIYDSYAVHAVLCLLTAPRNKENALGISKLTATVWDLKNTGMLILTYVLNIRALSRIAGKFGVMINLELTNYP